MSDPVFFHVFSSFSPQALRVGLALVDLDLDSLISLFLEVAWIAEVKVQPILFVSILYWGYDFQFMYFDLARWILCILTLVFDDVSKHMCFPLQ